MIRRWLLKHVFDLLYSINQKVTTMSAATDALNAAVVSSVAEQKKTNALLADVKSKLDAALAGGNNDPLVQAAADALNAQTAEDQAAEAAATLAP